MRCALLGPQRSISTVGEAARRLGVRGPVAVVTAGWLEREGGDDELAERIGVEVVELGLWARREAVRAADAIFATAADRLRQDIEELRRLYRRRLDHLMDAVREVFREAGDPHLLLPERRSALAALRELDLHFLARLGELRAAAPVAGGRGQPAVRRQRREIAKLAAPCDAVVLAGGHVVELLDCLRLFAVPELLDGRALLAWSAGAMALTPVVVGFHDHPPQGAGNAEVLDAGLDRCPGLVALPHARRRLDLEDPQRVALLARRFAPRACVALDEGDGLQGDGSAWRSVAGVRRLGTAGRLETVTAFDAGEAR